MVRHPKLRGHGLHPNQAYSPQEISRATGVAETTVRVWIRDGKLAAMTGGNPHLVLGCDITAFLQGLRKARKRMAPDEFRCMTCRAPRKPWGGLADFVHQGGNMGRLEALCETCGGAMSKGISLRNLPHLRTLIDVR